MKLDILHALNAERAARRAVVVVTDVTSGAQRLVKAADVAKDALKDVLEKRLRTSGTRKAQSLFRAVWISVFPSGSLFRILSRVGA